jgi:polyisoprenoid-binding protein YceI
MQWKVDPAHSHVGFSVRHMMVTTVRGAFRSYSGTFELDPADFTKSRISGEIDVASVDTQNPDRDNHLRTDEFFDLANHPKILFTSTAIEPKDDGYVVRGDLTLRGVTQNVALDVEFAGATKNPYGQTIIGVSATGTINRREFGVQYNAMLETGGVAVSDKVKIEIEVQAVRQG